jgi:hypothetical protein
VSLSVATAPKKNFVKGEPALSPDLPTSWWAVDD